MGGVWGIVAWCGEWELSLGVGVHNRVCGDCNAIALEYKKYTVKFQSCIRHSMTQQPNKKRKETTRMRWIWTWHGIVHERNVYGAWEIIKNAASGS